VNNNETTTTIVIATTIDIKGVELYFLLSSNQKENWLKGQERVRGKHWEQDEL
jgi:hypothetical protein